MCDVGENATSVGVMSIVVDGRRSMLFCVVVHQIPTTEALGYRSGHSFSHTAKNRIQRRPDMRLFLSTTTALAALLVTSDAFVPRHMPFVGRHQASPLTELYAGTEITMPALSSTMKEGRVVSWLKNEGDEIEAGEAIMVVESDKADMDVEAFEDGFLAKIIVPEGEMAPVGEAVALIASSEGEIDDVASSFGARGAAAPAAPAEAAPSGGR